jgi:hypothetical protein
MRELLLRTKHEHNSSYTANKRYAEIDIVEAH